MKIKKQILIILMIICTLISTILYTNPVQAANTSVTDLSLYSKGAVLMDATTGQILYGKAENEKLYPASTTKILTAI